MRLAILVVLCLVVVSAGASWADGFLSVWADEGATLKPSPSWWGSSGMALTPTAVSLPPLEASASWHRIQYDEGDLDLANLNVGVLPGLEVGGARLKRDGETSKTIGNAKYALPVRQWFKDSLFPQIAVGSWDLSNKWGRAYYVVASKTIDLASSGFNGGLLAFHAGYARNDSETGPLDGVFGGAELSAFKYTTILAEYDTENFNAVLRYQPQSRFSLEVGSMDSNFGFGFGYNSGF